MRKDIETTGRPGASNEEKPILHIAMVSPEIAPFAKTGGLGEVLGALPASLEKLGLKISLVMPAYQSVLQGAWKLEDTGIRLSVPVSDRQEEGVVLKTRVGKSINVYFIRADKYYARDYLYCGPEGDYKDNAERFVFFSRAVLELLRLDPPSVLHVHDWQSALSIVFLKAQPERYPELASTKTVLTIHNLGFQGIFWKHDWHLLNIDGRYFTPRYLEFYDNVNFLKGGIVFTNALNTVSPTHAEEIMKPEFGFGLEGVLRDRDKDLVGILNGMDYDVWNPETDCNIIRTYGTDDFAGKIMCKSEMQRMFGLDEDVEAPLLAMISRLTPQKGVELVQKASDELISRGVQFVLIGNAGNEYEEFFKQLASRYPGKVGVSFKFDEVLAHKAVAGADLLLIPSLYEPCGLTQLQGLRYGTPSVVRATGGLKDTIQEFNPSTRQGNGFIFDMPEVKDFMVAIDRALALFHQERTWLALMRNGMKADFSWKRSAKSYKDLYLKVTHRD